LKQDLHFTYDYSLDSLYSEIDDCNMKFIDTSNLKRYLVKCGVYASDATLIAIIRRMDLDADARLTQKEFIDGIKPMEHFTKSSAVKSAIEQKKKSKKGTSFKRPGTASAKSQSRYMTGAYSSLANTLHGSTTY